MTNRDRSTNPDGPREPATPNADRIGTAISQVRQALETLRAVDTRYMRHDVRPLLHGSTGNLAGIARNLSSLERQLRGHGGLAPDPAQRAPATPGGG